MAAGPRHLTCRTTMTHSLMPISMTHILMPISQHRRASVSCTKDAHRFFVMCFVCCILLHHPPLFSVARNLDLRCFFFFYGGPSLLEAPTKPRLESRSWKPILFFVAVVILFVAVVMFLYWFFLFIVFSRRPFKKKKETFNIIQPLYQKHLNPLTLTYILHTLYGLHSKKCTHFFCRYEEDGNGREDEATPTVFVDAEYGQGITGYQVR